VCMPSPIDLILRSGHRPRLEDTLLLVKCDDRFAS